MMQKLRLARIGVFLLSASLCLSCGAGDESLASTSEPSPEESIATISALRNVEFTKKDQERIASLEDEISSAYLEGAPLSSLRALVVERDALVRLRELSLQSDEFAVVGNARDLAAASRERLAKAEQRLEDEARSLADAPYGSYEAELYRQFLKAKDE